MKIINKLKKYYLYDLRLEQKLLFSHFVISVLAILLLTTLLYTNSARLLERKLLNSAETASEKTVLSLENMIQKYDNMTYSFSMMNTVTNIVTQTTNDYDSDDIRKDRNQFETTLFSCIPFQISSSIPDCDIKVFFDNSFSYFNNSTRYATYSSISNEPWFLRIYDNFEKNRRSFYILSSRELSSEVSKTSAFLSIARVMPNKNNYQSPLAILRLDFEPAYLNEAISQNDTDQSLTYLVSEDTNELIALSSPEHEFLYDEFITISNNNSTIDENTWNKHHLNGTDYFVIHQAVPSYPLTLITMLPVKNILSEYYIHRNYTFIIGGILLFFCLLFSSLLSKTMSNRIVRLTFHMKQIKEGNLLPLPSSTIYGKDEIGELTSTYDFMIHSMQNLIEREYYLGLETKNAELKMLQSQINPHFLYNTLDMIQWFAEEGMLSQIEEAISSLATFYRLSLSNGKEYISLREEIEHVRAYIRLQRLRFPDTFLYQETLDNSLLDYQIPKTSLQPLVENVITHGLQESRHLPGHLYLLLEKEGESTIKISISDDGVGLNISPQEILGGKCLQGKNGHGFGIYNVSSRFRLLYGTSYGLSFEANYPQGTIAIIRIPMA